MDAASILFVLAFAGQAGWGQDRYSSPPPAAAPIYDRYQAAPPSTGSGVAPPPGIADRTRTAVSETATTLRDGLEAGFEETNEQFNRRGGQMIDASRSAGQQFGREIEEWTENAGREIQTAGQPRCAPAPAQGTGSRQQYSNPFAPAAAPAPAPAASKARAGVAPPPWSDPAASSAPEWDSEPAAPSFVADRSAAPSVAATRTESGWTSIGSNLAAPPLLLPQLFNTTAQAAPRRPDAGNSGPGFPALPSGRDVFANRAEEQPKQAPPASDADSWAIGWGDDLSSQPATIGKADPDASRAGAPAARDAGAQASITARPQDSQPAARPGNDPWADNDPWAQQPQGPAEGAVAQSNGGVPAVQVANNPNSQPPAGTSANAVIETRAAAETNPAVSALAGGDPPWMPLLLVSVSLAGSLGANLFLGWSYMDARQKYRSLVQKTANKFRRAASAAAA